jgi:hypothetical protein
VTRSPLVRGLRSARAQLGVGTHTRVCDRVDVYGHNSPPWAIPFETANDWPLVPVGDRNGGVLLGQDSAPQPPFDEPPQFFSAPIGVVGHDEEREHRA